MFQGIGVAMMPIYTLGFAALLVIHVYSDSAFGVCWRFSEGKDQ
jgi:hypothetical protein